MECKANACGSNSRRCPCPQVCEVPEDDYIAPSFKDNAWLWTVIAAVLLAMFLLLDAALSVAKG